MTSPCLVICLVGSQLTPGDPPVDLPGVGRVFVRRPVGLQVGHDRCRIRRTVRTEQQLGL